MVETIHWLTGLFDWRFFAIFLSLVGLGLKLPPAYTKTFRSVKFNVYLLFVIAILSSIGTLYQSYDIYHTWYFSACLALMAFDVVVCKLRGGPKWISHDRRKQAPHQAEIKSAHSEAKTADLIKQWLALRKISFKERNVKKQTVLFATRHRLQKWGDFILHISIVGVLAGNLLGALKGFEEMMPVMEGTTYRMKNRPYDVTLNDFDIEYYQSTGAPSLYRSDIVVTENGRVIGQKKIIVNDPLDIHRVRFYQASWGMTDEFRSARLHLAGSILQLKPREVTRISGTSLSVRANMFYPTFDIDPEGRAINKDSQGKNPALQVDFLEHDKLRARLWLLKNNPETAFQVREGQVVPAASPPFFLIDVDPVLFSGIQVGYDPGAPVFWFFAVILLIGLCLHFYLHGRRVNFSLEPHGRTTRVLIEGWNSRTPEEFTRQFEDWTQELKKILGE